MSAMKFKIDLKYAAIQALKYIAAYIIAALFILYLLNLQDPEGFIISSLLAAITVYFICFFPRSIVIDNGIISFSGKTSYDRIYLNLTDIRKIEVDSKYYNTVTIFTKSGIKYTLHPADPAALISSLH